MKNLYLMLTIAGAVVPYVFFMQFMAEEGASPVHFLQSVFVNGAAGGFAADVLISSLVFWIFLFTSRQKRIPLYIVLNCTIGLSCALPCFLWLREKDLEAQQASLN
ncbi:MAG: DUF2834 domain-containing protein [Pseudomonadales bacterium]|nr:DUF2834 domain-containing protein [Pseudomonadales bacterium]